MDNDNISKFMSSSSKHIANINKVLKNIKSNILADFTWSDHQGLIVTTNKIVSLSDLSVIENYIKNIDVITTKNIMPLCLSQSKLYFKIINISYIMENTNMPINSSIVESIIKNTYIFNDVLLVSKPWVIKMSLKSDMTIIWVDI